MLRRTVWFSRSAMLGCLAVLIFSDTCTVQASALGIGAILTLPAPFPSPMLSLMVSLEFTLCLMFSLRFFQIWHGSQQPWKLDACDSWKNFYDLTFWMTSLVLSWDYEELLWDQEERINACPRDASDGNLGVD